MSTLVIAGSSASTTPALPGTKAGAAAAALKPVPVGTEVHTVSAQTLRAIAQRDARLHNSRGGHALAVVVRATRIFKGVGTKDPTLTSPDHHDHVQLAPPVLPTSTAGGGMPVFGTGLPVLAAAPLTPAANKLSPRDMRILVISADGSESDLGAIKADLDNVGMPYTVLNASQTPLTEAMLWDGVGRGFYSGVILTTNNLAYFNGTAWVNAFTDAQWQILWNYESSFGVRQVTSYTAAWGWPETHGLSVPVTSFDTTTTPVNLTLTTAGRAAFPYMATNISLPLKNAWIYESTVLEPATTVPLMVAPGGYPIVSTHTTADGRENLAITVANAPWLRHSQVLGYGIVNWVTKGLFVGKKRVSITPQIDDLFLDNAQWVPSAHSDQTGQIYRTSAADWQALINWQNGVRASSPLLAAIRLEFPFNGWGTTGVYRPDTLSAYVYSHSSPFSFLSHTWTHQNLDYANSENNLEGPTTAATIRNELTRNDTLANQRRFANYFKDSMVQPDVSGNLPTSAVAQQTAYSWGIRYWVSDTSKPEWNNPAPNVGFYAQYAPGLLIIPRHATNIYYNTSTPAQLVDEYNYFYAPGGLFPTFPSPRTYAQIIDFESDTMLSYLLTGDMDPLMFHISNFRAYDGVHSILGDALSAVFTKYRALYNIPIQGNNQHQLGLNMAQWMAYKSSGAQAVLRPCSSIQLTATKAAAVPITGVTFGASGDTYGGQPTSNVTVNPGQTVTVPLPATPC